MMFCRQLRCIRRLKPWKIIVTFRRTSRSSLSLIDTRLLPSSRTSPVVGLSSMLMQRTRVLLPAPLMPMMP